MVNRYDVFAQDLYQSKDGDYVSYEDYASLQKKQEKLKGNQAAALRNKIEAYVKAAVADSWKGAADPEDYESFVQELESAKNELESYIKKLTEGGAQ